MIPHLKTIVLGATCLFQVPQLYAQKQQISGIVTDIVTGKPLPGVSILQKGAGTKAATDANGRFSLDVPDPSTVLVFKFIGYDEQEVAVSDVKVLQIKLVQTNKSLEEVVVIGYGEVQRKDLTGSVGSVNMQDIKKAPVGSALEALAGRVAGVQVTSESGKPGSEMNIVIRGANSLTQDN